uniref:SRCR domain-containing protein n=1 Tax=Knipowitschia caucasica TaxID=637954 RepID=A0AAV2LDM8_KNICA
MKSSLSQTLCPECDEDLSVSDSVRLVGGSGLCSGSLQIWDQSWISVCEGALDLRGAEVLCRELGCRGPSVLQGELSSLGQTFHCEGHESALVDCPRSRPKTCPSGPSEDVICSEPLRLVGGASRCAGTKWRTQDSQVQDSQVQDSQVQVSQVGVQVVRVQLGSQFSVQCSVKPQFPGGSFQLLSPSGNHTLPAVNHSAHFLFNHTGPAHKGDYTCVYHLQVFNHSFTSESERLELRLGGGYQVDTGWIPGGYQVDTGWIPGGYRVDTGWIPGGYRVDTGWIPGGYQVDTRWIPGGYQVDTRWIPGGYQVDTRSSQKRREEETDQERREEETDQEERREETDQKRREEETDQKRREEETDQKRREEETDQKRREEETDQERREEETDQERREEETDQERREEETDQKRREEETDQKRREEETDQERR